MTNEINEFTGILKALAINAGIELTNDILKLYQAALEEFTIEQIRSASISVLSMWKYNRMPPIAVIIDHVDGASVKIEHKALIQANKIIEHLKAHGGSKIPKLNDPISQYLMTKRWSYYSWATSIIESEIKWWVKEFCKSYEAYDGDPSILIKGSKELKKLASGLFERI